MTIRKGSLFFSLLFGLFCELSTSGADSLQVASFSTVLTTCRFHTQPLPAALLLEVRGRGPGAGVQPGKRCSDSDSVNRPTHLIHCRDQHHICRYFSRAIYGCECGNPAYWMLEKTSETTWSLILRRVSHEVAEYYCMTDNRDDAPTTFKRVRVDRLEFENWPQFITVSPA